MSQWFFFMLFVTSVITIVNIFNLEYANIVGLYYTNKVHTRQVVSKRLTNDRQSAYWLANGTNTVMRQFIGLSNNEALQTVKIESRDPCLVQTYISMLLLLVHQSPNHRNWVPEAHTLWHSDQTLRDDQNRNVSYGSVIPQSKTRTQGPQFLLCRFIPI